jgi:hypothetical protein
VRELCPQGRSGEDTKENRRGGEPQSDVKKEERKKAQGTTRVSEKENKYRHPFLFFNRLQFSQLLQEKAGDTFRKNKKKTRVRRVARV